MPPLILVQLLSVIVVLALLWGTAWFILRCKRWWRQRHPRKPWSVCRDLTIRTTLTPEQSARLDAIRAAEAPDWFETWFATYLEMLPPDDQERAIEMLRIFTLPAAREEGKMQRSAT